MLKSKIRSFGLVWEDSPQNLAACPCWTLKPGTEVFAFKSCICLKTGNKAHSHSKPEGWGVAFDLTFDFTTFFFTPTCLSWREKSCSIRPTPVQKLARNWAFFFVLLFPVYFSVVCFFILCNTKMFWQLTHDGIRPVNCNVCVATDKRIQPTFVYAIKYYALRPCSGGEIHLL